MKTLHLHLFDAEILTGSNRGERVLIPKIDLAPNETNLPFTLRRRQFPIILACHHNQQISDTEFQQSWGFPTGTSVFHRQLYVAISRTRDENELKIFIVNAGSQGKTFAKQ